MLRSNYWFICTVPTRRDLRQKMLIGDSRDLES
jgi:hypothetical protein